MWAVTEVVPVSPPMVSVTCTGFLVPVKSAPFAFAWKAYRSVSVGLITAFSRTPSMTPWKVKDPSSLTLVLVALVLVLFEGARRDAQQPARHRRR